MKKAVLVALGMTALLVPFAMKTSAQQGSKPATYITKAEVDAVNATPGVDRTIRVVDIGNEHYSVGIIHRDAPALRRAGRLPAAVRVAAARVQAAVRQQRAVHAQAVERPRAAAVAA